ncbi:hypothetical protein [Teredinibacter sp. KSP-S5-2]|uniref:hypothetical protein n=1 Tax=Teredinibacter sp. KSP-S5-2 TaxID=3034506 RepID=UPI002934906E|nr:hypothetical protein [Teredinibacter sp. KSP-S5-2]WNO10391.1 AHH domain-containing protein [Teredinibacter sp. KSP-S5-2]
MAKKKNHFIIEANKQKHISTKGGTEGGACLTGHDSARHSNFGRKNSCNFRYQAVEQAKSNSEIKKYLHSYNDHLDEINERYAEEGGVMTSAFPTNSGNMYPARYMLKVPVPGKGDWDVGGPPKTIRRRNFGRRDARVKMGKNFTQDTWPYWQNAHHLIPKGTLKKAIVDEPYEVGRLMEKGLLQAKYNINHKINMLLIPQDKEVGRILDMPRHLVLKEGDDASVEASCTDHPVYNEMVRDMDKGLTKILEGYRKTIQNAEVGECEEPDFELDKKKLEDLSEELLELILEWEGGRSLDSLARLNQ